MYFLNVREIVNIDAIYNPTTYLTINNIDKNVVLSNIKTCSDNNFKFNPQIIKSKHPFKIKTKSKYTFILLQALLTKKLPNTIDAQIM